MSCELSDIADIFTNKDRWMVVIDLFKISDHDSKPTRFDNCFLIGDIRVNGVMYGIIMKIIL